jgi:hypothetical protein
MAARLGVHLEELAALVREDRPETCGSPSGARASIPADIHRRTEAASLRGDKQVCQQTDVRLRVVLEDDAAVDDRFIKIVRVFLGKRSVEIRFSVG